MCRIAGIINTAIDQKQLLKEVELMCDAMSHGGPDGKGTYQDEIKGLVFGHRRLSIIDLSANGKQPMSYHQHELTITFNGEIYNYKSLRSTLQALGFEFRTQSDTEVILAGFSCWGIEVFHKLNGMFAFALYDQRTNCTYLVRDRSGIKPLFYSKANNQLVFASEVKAFKNLFKEENQNWKIYFLAFGHIPEPFTTLNNVSALAKGHFLKWDHQHNRAETFRFHQEDYTTSVSSTKEAEQLIRTQLRKSIWRHLIADAPIGVFLSGGIDSSLIALLANEMLSKVGQQTHTVSINFDQPKFSEKAYQQLIIDKIDGIHQNYTIDGATFDAHFPKALSAMDQPSTDGINSWFISYYAKQNGLKAVLSGIGADELFGGYPSFTRIGWVNLLSAWPSALFKIGLLGQSSRLRRLYYLSYNNTIGKYLCLRGVFTPDDISKLLNVSRTHVDQTLLQMDLPHLPHSLSKMEQASWMETNLYMQNQLLKDTDLMSMQHGIEVRVPFLDQELQASLLKINPAIRFDAQRQKGLLIKSFVDLLPKKIWDRPKMGFTFPFENWLKENPYFLNGLSQLKNRKAIELVADFKKGKLHWSKAMAIYHIFNHAN